MDRISPEFDKAFRRLHPYNVEHHPPMPLFRMFIDFAGVQSPAIGLRDEGIWSLIGVRGRAIVVATGPEQSDHGEPAAAAVLEVFGADALTRVRIVPCHYDEFSRAYALRAEFDIAGTTYILPHSVDEHDSQPRKLIDALLGLYWAG